MKLDHAATMRVQHEPSSLAPIMGVDMGKKHDPTAIAVAEIVPRESETALVGGRQTRESHFVVRHLERLPLGTPYPEVARRLGSICRRVADRSGRRPVLYVDATGVGQPVVDTLAASSPEARLWSVYFTHGNRRTEYRAEGKVTLGKARLVSRLQALLQCRRLHLPTTAEARALAQELLDYEIRVDENARDRYGAFRVGTHDDLVTAVGLAVQDDPPGRAFPTEAYR